MSDHHDDETKGPMMNVKGRRRRAAAQANGDPGVAGGIDLLSTSPFKDDLEAELEPGPAASVRPGLTVWLAAGVLLVGGFAGGIEAHKEWGPGTGGAAATGARTAPAAGGRAQTGQAGQQGQAAAPGGAGRAGGATFGTVKLVDGKTIYLQTTTGIVQVKVDGSTKISVTKEGALKDLDPGATLIVQGTAGKDGTMTASSVSEGGFPGAGAGAAPAGRTGGG